MKLLFIGDIIGEPGRKKICGELSAIIKKEGIFFTIAQGENLAGGFGMTKSSAQEILDAGVDCITSGNHVWKHKEIYEYIEAEKRVLRPANYPDGVPGKGYGVYEKQGVKIAVINLEGRAFMKPLEDPFRTGKALVEKIVQETKNIFIDFHAEATGEKRALALFLAGSATGIIGTHTHVQTADEQVLAGKTAYITDVGMVGAADSVIGDAKDEIIRHYLLQMPVKFKVAKGDVTANCVIIDFDESSGDARSIARHNF